MLKIKKEDVWKVYREEVILDNDEHRDLVFLAATTYAENGETIEVYDENGTFDFNFEVSDIVWD